MIALAQVADRHPKDYKVSCIFPHLAVLNGVRVRVGGRRQHPVAGDFELPEIGDWGLVAFYQDLPSGHGVQAGSGVWLTSLSDHGRHMIPEELLAEDPWARLDHHASDQWSILHGDGSLEKHWADGTMLRVTGGKDGTAGNTTKRAKRTARKVSVRQGAGYPIERKTFTPQDTPPVDIELEHSSGAKVRITADGSFLMQTPKGHKIRLHDATEKARSATTGAVTSTPEEDASRVTSELELTTELGHKIVFHDDPVNAADRYVRITTALGHVFEMRDKPDTQQWAKLTTVGGHTILAQDLPAADKKIEATTAAGHKLLLDDGAVKQAKLSTVGGRHLTLNDTGTLTTLKDAVKILIQSAAVEIDSADVKIGTGATMAAERGGASATSASVKIA